MDNAPEPRTRGEVPPAPTPDLSAAPGSARAALAAGRAGRPVSRASSSRTSAPTRRAPVELDPAPEISLRPEPLDRSELVMPPPVASSPTKTERSRRSQRTAKSAKASSKSASSKSAKPAREPSRPLKGGAKAARAALSPKERSGSERSRKGRGPGPAGAAAAEQARAEALTASAAAWAAEHDPELPGRLSAPSLAVLHLGPTNSGKTHDALLALAASGSGVYAAPLRQLAHEAFAKLSALAPEGMVGLSTGEEEINPRAPIIAATVEKAPTRGALLVLDEAHWVTDPDRGHHWTRLALAGRFDHLHIIAAAEARELLLPLVADAQQVEVVEHARLGELTLTGKVSPSQVAPGTLVVAFSRKAVYAIARELDSTRSGRVGVLYGALPPITRREVIAKFVAGEFDVLVCTDVIGHGINVPATTVLFAETSKFDGTERRSLHTWEAAQIAGRAGRFNLAEAGAVGVLTGVAGLSASAGLVEMAAAVARGTRISDLPQTLPRIRPELADLNITSLDQLPVALRSWATWAAALAPERSIAVDDITPLLVRAQVLSSGALASLTRDLDVSDAWRMINLALDYNPPRSSTWLDLSRAALLHLAGRVVDPALVLDDNQPTDIEGLESLAARARDAQTLLRAFPATAGLSSKDAAAVEARVSSAITKLLPSAIRASAAGRCRSCGEPCAPWFPSCEECHFASRRPDWY